MSSYVRLRPDQDAIVVGKPTEAEVFQQVTGKPFPRPVTEEEVRNHLRHTASLQEKRRRTQKKQARRRRIGRVLVEANQGGATISRRKAKEISKRG